MLKIIVKDCDIAEMTKLLARSNVNGSVDNRTITIRDGKLSEKLAKDLCENVNIVSIINFDMPLSDSSSISTAKNLIVSNIHNDETIKNEQKDVNTEPTEQVKHDDFEKFKHVELVDETDAVETTLSTKLPSHEVLFSTVKYGEIYLVDFGERYDSEMAFLRPAVIVQNDAGNISGTTTIVLPFTSKAKRALPTHLVFDWSLTNLKYFSDANWLKNPSTIMAEQIKVISKSRLKTKLGVFREDFMEKIQQIIEYSLAIKPRIQTVVKTKVETQVKTVTHVVEKKVPVHTGLDLKEVQISLLSFVDVTALLTISQNVSLTNEERAKEIMELFGFDFNKKGTKYILDAILLSPRNEYVNLKELSTKISQSSDDTSIDCNEIERLMVARIKENFSMKKSPAIHFIRLVSSLINNNNNMEEHSDENTL